MLLSLLSSFIFGGLICLLVQILIDKTSLTPARILVGLVSLGVFLFGIGAYEPLFDMFGCGVSVPLLGFGAVIGKGVKDAVDTEGFLGIFSGGLSASSVGITVTLLFALIISFFTKGKAKKM